MTAIKPDTSRVIGFDSCLYDVVRDVVYEQGGVIFGIPAEAAAHAIKLAEWSGAPDYDAAVRTCWSSGIRELVFESAESLVAGDDTTHTIARFVEVV